MIEILIAVLFAISGVLAASAVLIAFVIMTRDSIRERDWIMSAMFLGVWGVAISVIAHHLTK